MRKTIITLALILVGFSASAQFTLGPRVALTSSNLNLKDAVATVEEGDAEFGYQFGLFARFKVPILGLYVQPEALFSSSDNTLNVNNTAVDLSFNRIDVPVMVGGKVGPLRINAGPSFSFLTSAESDIGGVVTDVKDNYNSTTVGFQAGVGLDLLKFVFDIKYEGSLSTFGESINVANTAISTDQRVSQFVFALGFKLF